MKRNLIWVAAGALLQLLYIAAACWHCWNGRVWEAVGVGGFGWLGCLLLMLLSMRNATLDGLGELLDEAESMWKEARDCAQRSRELMDAIEAEAEKGGILSHPLVACPKCGGTIWLEIGGRMECVKCGAPLPSDLPDDMEP